MGTGQPFTIGPVRGVGYFRRLLGIDGMKLYGAMYGTNCLACGAMALPRIEGGNSRTLDGNDIYAAATGATPSGVGESLVRSTNLPLELFMVVCD